MTGADIHNAEVLRQEWQQRALGDRVPMASPGVRALGGDVTSTVIHLLEPERAIGDTPGRFVLYPVSESTTRLLPRESLNDPTRAGGAWVVWDPMHFVMEHRLLLGVKERAEGRPVVPGVVQAAAQIGWAMAAFALFGAFMSRRAWRLWVLLPVAVMATPLWLTGDVNSFVAGFLALGITVIGFLAFGWRWLPPYLLVAATVALVLLLSPDSFAAFGVMFLILLAAAWGAFHERRPAGNMPEPYRHVQPRTRIQSTIGAIMKWT